MTRDEEIALLHAMYGSYPDRRDAADYNPNTMLEENRWLWRHIEFLQACLLAEQRSRRWWSYCDAHCIHPDCMQAYARKAGAK